jgi:hypothetical protein
MNEFGAKFDWSLAHRIKLGKYSAANSIASFENCDRDTCAGKLDCSRHSSCARANHDYIGMSRHRLRRKPLPLVAATA